MIFIWKPSHFCPLLSGKISPCMSTHLSQEQSSKEAHLTVLNADCMWGKASSRQWTNCKRRGPRESHLFLSGPDVSQDATAAGCCWEAAPEVLGSFMVVQPQGTTLVEDAFPFCMTLDSNQTPFRHRLLFRWIGAKKECRWGQLGIEHP